MILDLLGIIRDVVFWNYHHDLVFCFRHLALVEDLA